MPIEQPHNPITPIQEQLSSTSSASTIVAGNEPNVTTISTNLSDIKNSNTGATNSSNPLEDMVSGNQDTTSAITRDAGSSVKVRI